MRQLTNFGGGVSIIALTFALFLMIIFMPTSFGFYCPTDCNCFQRTVRCIRARLQTIPKLPSDAVIVDLRYNHFEELSARTFNDLHQVTTLFLNENEITYIQDSTFDGLNSLKFLYLNNNRLSRLPAKIFQALPQLEAIYLENNDIWQIDENTFDNLPRLNRIFLFNNKITNLPANAFTRLPSLKRLRLDGNPIACNCGIYSLWQHHQRHSQRQAITIALTCETPAALYRYTFTNLQEYHFHCKKPEILVAPHDIQAKIGETIELPCRMKGDPQPDIVWLQNTNEITSDYDATHKMQILPSGTLQIHAIENSDIGIYECIGRNEVGETHTQPIRLLVTNTNNNNEYKQVNNNQPDNQISNQLWNEQHTPQQQQQQQQKSQQQQQHQLLNSPISSRYTSQLVDNVENTGNSIETIGQHQQTPPPTQSTKAKPSKNIWQNQQQHEQANVYEKITTQGPPSAPHFLHTPQDHTVALNDEREVRLDCQAYGKPKPIINWYFNGRLITQSTNNIRIQTNGSLVIKPTTQQIAGNYRCEAKNQWGSIQATSFIDIKELPEILMAPQNQTVKIGQNFILECDADGNPIPIIIWLFNGTKIVTPEINAKANSNNNVAGITTSPTSTAASAMTAAAIPAGAIVNNGHLILENENTELIVNNAQESDRGIYTCIAENENGRTSVSATVIVERMLGMPRLLIEPFNLEAFTGTTIELPCKPDELKGVQINWRKDGRIIDPKLHGSFNVKYEISRTGSLFVKNVTILDGGRYECSVKNDFGRATASALIIIKDNINLAPGDRYVRIAFEEAAKEIDMAINNTIDMLFTKRNRANRPINSQPNYGELLRVFRFPNGEARQLARAAEIYERTLVNIRKHVLMGDNLTIESDKYEFRDLLSRDHLNLVAQLSGCMEHRQMPNCTDMCFHSKYRSIDGTCNNLMQPTWGASLTAFRRLEKPIYENGFSMPIGWMKDKLYSGFPKPSSRLVSTTLISTKENTPDNRITHMVMQWGQFLDHDLDHAIPAVSSESWDGIDCKKTCDFAPPCYPIEVPPNDPRVKNRRCIDLVRSSSICGSGMTSVFFNSIQHREQINQLTSYIDGSQVYGFSEAFANDLRNLTTDDGLLRVGVHFPNQREMLPFAAPQDGIDCRRNLDENQMNCFVAGDIRANEQVGLLAMHTIWMREHNRIATQLRYINPHWNGDTIYYEARKIVGAIMQHITYKYWLPIILGYSGMEKLGTYKGYNANLEPTISNEFATAALRFGHTLINPILHRLNATFQPISQGHLQLHKAFFAPWRLAYEGGVDPLMRGMFVTPAKLKKPDQNLNTELTEKLFQTAHAVALDLAAINIQRGRDHGIPSYNQYRQFCNLTVAHTFDDLSREISNRKVRDKLKVLYGHPDNIDLFVGGILEDQIHDAKVGPLFQCLLIEQFRRLRDGDRLYYENPQVFLPQQLEQIKQSNLARILCDNGDNIKEVTDNVFILPDLQDGYKSCDDIPGINLYLWQECSSCNSLPQLFDSYIPQIYPKKNRQNKREIRTKEAEVLEEYEPDMEMKLQELFDINEERVSGLEEVISSFQKEFKKLHRKIHKIEENCEASASNFNRGSNGNSVTNINTNNNNQNGPNENINIGKYKRNHCVDNMGTTRLNNEVWTPDYCTKCECRRNQISCMHEKCPELNCLPGVEAITPPMACCPHCMPLITKDKLIKT